MHAITITVAIVELQRPLGYEFHLQHFSTTQITLLALVCYVVGDKVW